MTGCTSSTPAFKHKPVHSKCASIQPGCNPHSSLQSLPAETDTVGGRRPAEQPATASDSPRPGLLLPSQLVDIISSHLMSWSPEGAQWLSPQTMSTGQCRKKERPQEEARCHPSEQNWQRGSCSQASAEQQGSSCFKRRLLYDQISSLQPGRPAWKGKAGNILILGSLRLTGKQQLHSQETSTLQWYGKQLKISNNLQEQLVFLINYRCSVHLSQYNQRDT